MRPLPSRLWLGAAALSVLVASTAPVLADTPFTTPATLSGDMAALPDGPGPILPGGTAELRGRGLQPGLKITFRQSGEALNGGAPVTVSEDGTFALKVQIPDTARAGAYPVVAEVAQPPYATTFDLRVAPDLGKVGQDRYTLDRHDAVDGLYQVAEAPDLGAVYVAGAVGRPPVENSTLAKLDARTLKVTTRITPAPAQRGVYAVYGLAVDQTRGQVWTTNSRQNTIAVYGADQLKLIKQFPDGTVAHPRDVKLYGDRAYVNATFTPKIEVFDQNTLDHVQTIELQSSRRGQSFGTGGMAVDPANDQLFVAGLATSEVAVVDLSSGRQIATYDVPGAQRVIGVAVDAARGHIYTANAGSDDVSILDAGTGKLIHSVPVGASPLNLAVTRDGDVYVAVRGSGTVVVLSPGGEVKANLPVGTYPNHLIAEDAGTVLVVNKSRGAEDPDGDKITRISPKM